MRYSSIGLNFRFSVDVRSRPGRRFLRPIPILLAEKAQAGLRTCFRMGGVV